MKQIEFSWNRASTPHASLRVDGRYIPTEDIKRVVVVLDASMDEPVLDVSHGTPLPLSLSDDGPRPHTSVTEFLDYVDIEALKHAVLNDIGGLDGDDPVTLTLMTLRRWADVD